MTNPNPKKRSISNVYDDDEEVTDDIIPISENNPESNAEPVS
jgi:hypothetical protein